jgi:ClpP class serine protease
MKHLERLEAVFASGPLYIERAFMDRLATRFLAEMDVWGDGNTVTEEIKARRRQQEPELLTLNENGTFTASPFTLDTIQARAGQFAHLKLSGAMQQEDFLSTQGIQTLAAQIRQADASPNIDGILIETNTGGGELLAGQTLRNAIKDTKKPVLVYAHYLASAGIWGTLFADHIMAAGKGSEFGSIGVFTQINKQFLGYYKEHVMAVYSRKSPNKNKDFRSLLDGDASVLEDSVTQADEIFMADVRRNRPLAGDIEGTLSGAMFYADEAKSRGLVDSIGTFADAVAQLGRMARAQKQGNMSKVSLKKFLGIEAQTEEQAVEALESAEPETQTKDAGAALEAIQGAVEALQAAVQNLTTEAETLRSDIAALKEKPEPAIPDVEAAVNNAVNALRTEVAGQINALKATRSGGEVAGEEGLDMPGKDGDEKPKVDLLSGVKAKQVKVMNHLS